MKGAPRVRDLEQRNQTGVVEYRAKEKGLGELVGYAAVFNRFSQNLGGFVEQVDPGAFNKSLADEVPVFARFNHDSSLLLGTTEAGTLRLEVDGTGLRYSVDLPDTQAGRDVRELAKRGDLRYSSFAFQTLDDEWDLTPDGFPLRTLTAVRLFDVAPVTDPAYRDTTAAMRSLADKTHVPLDQIKSLVLNHTDEVRSLITSDAHGERKQDDGGQVDNHPAKSYYQRLRWMK
jgi:uncharacterized protein